jgi:hypothetical protein
MTELPARLAEVAESAEELHALAEKVRGRSRPLL